MMSWYKNVDRSMLWGCLNLLPHGALETTTILIWALGSRASRGKIDLTISLMSSQYLYINKFQCEITIDVTLCGVVNNEAYQVWCLAMLNLNILFKGFTKQQTAFLREWLDKTPSRTCGALNENGK